MSLAILFILITSGQVYGQTPLITNIDGRQTINLGGAVAMIIDPYGTVITITVSAHPNGYFKTPNEKPSI